MMKNKIVTKIMIALILIAVVGTVLGISWAITCGIIKLICLCFGVSFSLLRATGTWLVLVLTSSFFKITSSTGKKD